MLATPLEADRSTPDRITDEQLAARARDLAELLNSLPLPPIPSHQTSPSHQISPVERPSSALDRAPR